MPSRIVPRVVPLSVLAFFSLCAPGIVATARATAVGAETLAEAAANGHFNQVKDAVEAGQNLNAPGPEGRTALMLAAASGNARIVQYLLEKGALPNLADPKGLTALHLATSSRSVDTVSLLLDNKANPNAATPQGITPLEDAVHDFDWPVVAQLLLHGGAYGKNRQIPDNATMLDIAAQSGSADAVKMMLGKGISLDAVDSKGLNVLDYAAYRDNPETFTLLLASGASFGADPGPHETKLMLTAIRRDEPNVIDFFVKRGHVSMKPYDASGRTPLHDAAVAGDPEIIKALVAGGAELNARRKRGSSPLDDAAMNNQDAACAALIEAGADINAQSDRGETPMILAAARGYLPIVQRLVAAGAHLKAMPQTPGSPGNPAEVVPLSALQNAERAKQDAVADFLTRLETTIDADAANNPTDNAPSVSGAWNTVYKSGFQVSQAVTSPWSVVAPASSETTAGSPLTAHAMDGVSQPVLGPMGRQAVRLALANLPKHTAIRLTFDLVISGDWHGNLFAPEPDLWSLKVSPGRLLIDTTFFNQTRQFPRSHYQAFPDDYLHGFHEGRSGAEAAASSGATAVYRIERVVAHQGDSISFVFAGLPGLRNRDSVWGIANVVVSAATSGSGGAKSSPPPTGHAKRGAK